MAYRGPGLSYKIRKTTSNNRTGDNYSITVPKVVAKQFEECFFKLCVSGDSIIFRSGCKMTVNDIEIDRTKKIFTAGGEISFR